MSQEISHNEQEDRANILQQSIVAIVAGGLSVSEAFEQWDKAYDGISSFGINHTSGVNGEVRHSSAIWALGSRSFGLYVQAENSEGTHQLQLALGPDNKPNFQLSAVKRQ
jgi:hypothetical protein